MSDYLAVINNGVGGSHARGASKDDVVARVPGIHKSGWERYTPFPEGKQVTIHVIDVSGFGEVCWDDDGFHGKVGDGDWTTIDRPVERIKHTY